MAAKKVNHIHLYKMNNSNNLRIKVEVKYGQRGTTNIYKNGSEIAFAKINDFEIDITVNKNDEIVIMSTVADISKQTDETGIDITLTGGSKLNHIPLSLKADSGDIVSYDTTIYIL